MLKIIQSMKGKKFLTNENMKNIYIGLIGIGFCFTNTYNLNNRRISTAVLYC